MPTGNADRECRQPIEHSGYSGAVFPCPTARNVIESPGPAARLYCVWAILAIGVSVWLAGPVAQTLTRLLVIAFLALQFAVRDRLMRAFATRTPALQFVLLGMALAAVVEGCHMISAPVFPALRIDRDTAAAEAIVRYALDLLFTLPAYAVIFSVIGWFARRYRYCFWEYLLAAGFAQAIGDGGLFFFADAPAMLVFLPYPMSNYHAVNLLPYLALRARGAAGESAGRARLLLIPAVIATYLACGAMIRLAGRLREL